MSDTKPIGKLKNGTRFLYGDLPDVMIVTGSGYGRPHILFEKETDRKDTYVTTQKKDHVIVLPRHSKININEKVHEGSRS